MSPLQALILDRMRERGWEAKDVEARGVAHATLHRYTNALVMRQPPRKAILQNLADALELPLSTVERAAVESVGYEYTTRLAGIDPPARAASDITRQIIELIREHPGLHPVNKAHLMKQVEILTHVPLDAPLTPHEEPAEITVEEADERDLTSLAELSDRRKSMDKSPRPPRRHRQ